MTTATTKPTQSPPARRHWTQWIGYVAAGWSAMYATTALVWTVTGEGFPFGEGNPDSIGLLRNLPAQVGAPLVAAVLVAATVASLVMAGRGHPPRPLRALLLGFGWLVAGMLLVVVPEPDVLALAGYAPLLIVGAPFGWPPGVDYAEAFDWPLLNQAFAILGGFFVAATVLAWQRRTRAEDGVPAWAAPAAAARWGRWAVYVAVVVPLTYAVTRYAWLLGIPMFVTDEFIDDLHADGAAWAGGWLATFAVIGAVLTLGLVQQWGERFPRWMIGLAGRRVPIMLAVGPASVVSVLVTSAGLGLSSDPSRFAESASGFWFYLPQLLWPVWGAALGTATLAYYLRRRAT
ncbi:MAG TPA: hypothetical protein VFR23_17190 [Jiangellaceae bacterium]|nr:hypothetical protein [Jiangellaceae bacterium]